MLPAPITRRRSPASICDRSTARTAQASGSAKEAVSKDIEAGRRNMTCSTCNREKRTSSAKPHGSMAVALNWGHMDSLPWRQARQRPQGTWWAAVTRSPGATRVTPGPTACTTPASSWPRRAPALRSGWRSLARSVPQRPHTRISTRTSPGSSCGGGTSQSAKPPEGCGRIALIAAWPVESGGGCRGGARRRAARIFGSRRSRPGQGGACASP